MNGTDIAAIRAAAERLQVFMQEAGTIMYQQGQAGSADGDAAADGGARSDEDVIEGEFTDNL
jgi:molecular chaperone DnaK